MENANTRNCRADAIAGCLLGTAVGDALGLPAEGLTARRQRRLFPDPDGYRLLPGGRGLVSDDTEHACLVAQALVASAGGLALFENRFARELRLWLLLLPAGVGFATLRATLRLLIGISPARSGVFSAGNGPAMRAPLLGVCFGHHTIRLRELVRTTTRITHTDPKAEFGALTVALAAHAMSAQKRPSAQRYLTRLARVLPPDEGFDLLRLAQRAAVSAARGESTQTFAAETLGLTYGVSGYVYHTVPVVLHAWFRYLATPGGDLRTVLQSVIRCGGDTDTTAAILGGILGAGIGRTGLSPGLLNGLAEWPRTVAWMERLAERLAHVVETGAPRPPLPLFLPSLAARNVFFLLVVLAHGFRRLAPPY